MEESRILERVYPLIGGKENVSRTISRKDALYLTVKDASVVDLPAVQQVAGIASAALERSRLTLHLPESTEKENIMAQDYQKMGEDILAAVGGKENVSALGHCATRLRFNLVDESKIDDAKLKAIKGVMGTRRQSGQFQVIIGQDVSFPL